MFIDTKGNDFGLHIGPFVTRSYCECPFDSYTGLEMSSHIFIDDQWNLTNESGHLAGFEPATPGSRRFTTICLVLGTLRGT